MSGCPERKVGVWQGYVPVQRENRKKSFCGDGDGYTNLYVEENRIELHIHTHTHK